MFNYRHVRYVRPDKPRPTRIEIIDGVEVAVPIPLPPPPHGLMMLTKNCEMYIKLESDWIDVYGGMKAGKKYGIYNEYGRRLYYALEYSWESNRFCFGRSRPFLVHILDYRGKVSMKVRRKCTGGLLCCCQCCCNTITIHSGFTGELHGYVKAVSEHKFPTYMGYNGKGELLFRLSSLEKGFTRPCWGRKIPFRIHLADEKRSPIGICGRIFTGLGKALFRKAYQFGAYFDKDWDPISKAVLLGGMFGIGFLDYPQLVYV